MIKYLGSKKKLLSNIVNIIKEEKSESVLDLFSGTSRVGHILQNNNISVISNDHNKYAHCLATTYVQANPNDYIQIIPDIIKDLNNINGYEGWFSDLYSNKTMFFHSKNAIKIQAIRDKIENEFENGELKEILICSLIDAADKVDSTCGMQMSYLKSYAKRAYDEMVMKIPDMSKGSGKAIMMDAEEAAKIETDLAYIDPPYNQHSYLSNYHIWETICLWDNPQTYGKIHKRIDIKTRKSLFNGKNSIKSSFENLINNLSAQKCLISFNNEGYLSYENIIEVINKKFNKIEIYEIPYKRYIGAKIGIYNPKGEKVGKVNKTENIEYLFLGKNI